MILYGEVWKGEKVGEVHFVWVDGDEHMKTFNSDNIYEVLTEISENGWQCYSVLNDSGQMFGADKRLIYYVCKIISHCSPPSDMRM